MASFKDQQGRQWRVAINVRSCKQVREEVGVDLFAMCSGGDFAGFDRDPVAMVDVLYVLCRDQCIDQEVADTDFGQLFAGEVIAHAGDALMDAIADFCPNPKIAQGLREVRQAQKKAEMMAASRAIEEIKAASTDEAIAATIDDALERAKSGNTPSGLQASAV